MLDQSTRRRRPKLPPTEDAFWAAGVRADSGCLEWGHYRFSTGYGGLSRDGRRVLVHRVAWEYAYGPIPPGMRVLHHCDNPPCFEPTHLFLGSQKDNAQDMARKGRQWLQNPERRRRGDDFIKPEGWIKYGPDNRNSVLDADKVREIRRMRADGMILKDIAAHFGINLGTVWQVVNRKTWKEIE